MGKAIRKLDSLLHAHAVVAIDTPVFIYHFEAHPLYQRLTTPIFEAIESGSPQAVISTLARLEIMVRPLRENRTDIADSYRFLLDTFPNLSQISIDSVVADKAAELRATMNLATPDSLHLATALTAGATLFITNDADFSQEMEQIDVLILDAIL